MKSSFSLRLSSSVLGEVTSAEISSAAVLHHIFTHFCIGKLRIASQRVEDLLLGGDGE